MTEYSRKPSSAELPVQEAYTHNYDEVTYRVLRRDGTRSKRFHTYQDKKMQTYSVT